jgi:hypothetical protein
MISKPKFDFQLMVDKIFRKTVFLAPQPDGSLRAVNITGLDKGYYKDDIGSTMIEPICITKVRGLKNVSYVCTKVYNTTDLVNLFQPAKTIVCPQCETQLWSPHEQMTEKGMADLIDLAESAGRLQAEKEGADSDTSKKMNMVLLGVGLLVIIFLFNAMKGG